MRGASIGIFIILVVIGVVISGCTEKQADTTEKTTTEQYSGAPTPAGTPADAAQSGVNVPWLIEKKGIMGKYFEIDRGQLPVEANGWKAVFYDNKFNDNVIDPDDGVVAEMVGGILGDKAIIIVDEDVFKLHGDDFGVKPKGENAFRVRKEDVKEIAPGIYYYEWDLKVKGGVGASVLHPLSEPFAPGEENGFGDVAFKKQ